jgi:hypothetical protein
MDNFNLHSFFKQQYLTEAFEYGDLAKSHTAELEKISNNNPSVSMGSYGGDRPDSDSLKGKGYGSLSFIVRNELSNDEWNNALNWVKSKGYEVVSDSNYYEKEYDNDRMYYPKIKFQFNTEDIKL